jgi:hypothetical protein
MFCLRHRQQHAPCSGDTESSNHNHLTVLSTFSVSNSDPTTGRYTRDSYDLKISRMSPYASSASKS